MAIGLEGGGWPEDDGRWPRWLMPLLSTPFFVQCKLHAGVHKSKCNMYCLQCMDGALCSRCLSHHHRGHKTIQIRKASHRDSVRIKELEMAWKGLIDGVQPYSINDAKIAFLNKHPKEWPGKGAANKCKVCEHRLIGSSPSFCSLGCKIAGTAAGYIRKNTLPKKNKNRERKTMDAAAEDAEELPPATSVSSFRVKRRKGVPRRAALSTLVLEH